MKNPAAVALGRLRSRNFRSAVISAIENMAQDPRTMAAVDLLADGFSAGIPGMLDYLWKNPEAIGWEGMMGIQYSPKRIEAVLLITGKSWYEWSANV